MRKLNGFTLIELIVVLSIFMLLLGLSTAVYMSFKGEMTVRGASTQVMGMVQTAHNSALVSRQKTFIVEKNVFFQDELLVSHIYSFGQLPVGMWHLDDEANMNDDGVSHGYGGNLNVSGFEDSIVIGRIGSAINIAGSMLSCPNTHELFTPSDGIAGSLWVKFDRPASDDAGTVDDCSLIQLGNAYRFFVQGGQLGLTIGPNTILSTSKDEPYFLLPEKWFHLSFSYDIFTRRMAIFVNKAEKGHFDFTDDYMLPLDDSDLTIASGVYGVVDEISLLGVLESATFELPGALGMDINKALVGIDNNIRQYQDGENEILIKVTSFDEKGWLDDSFNSGAVIKFKNFANSNRTEDRRIFNVNRQGLVEVQ